MKELKRKERKKFDKRVVSKVESKVFGSKERFSYVDIYLNSDDIYVSYSNKSLIKEEIFDYIERLYLLNLKEESLDINFKFNGVEETEQKKIITKIKEEYEYKFVAKKLEIHRTNLISLILLVIGLLLLSLYVVLSVVLNYQFSEMISIFSWVFIWESVDYFVFENGKNRKQLIELRHIIRANFNIKNEE